MKLGQKVMLICRKPDDSEDPIWPPTGASGVIHAELDKYGDYDVMFDDHPCPVSLPDESWVVPKGWIIPIDEVKNHHWMKESMSA